MSLYFEAAAVLSGPSHAGSLKSRVYTGKWKSPPAQIYALIVEVAKYNECIKEVIDNAGILAHESKLTPILSLLLVHDFLLSKRGIAAPSNHPLRLAVERHKSRLNAELTKLRVRRGCASKEELKHKLVQDQQVMQTFSPRWIRINNTLTTLDHEMKSTFTGYESVSSLSELAEATADERKYFLDEHIPDLMAISRDIDITSSSAYKEGRIILQDKASCFPAYLLLGDHPGQWKGDLIDGCAAPGNKTTHLASLLSSAPEKQKSRVFSLDASHSRSKILQTMVKKAGASNIVTVLPGQDFLALDPADTRFQHVTALLLDPSCSGSGITKREDVPQLDLPKSKSELTLSTTAGSKGSSKNRKRKRENPVHSSSPGTSPTTEAKEDESERLAKLANLQSQIVEHAFGFPAATRVTYSTCSIHHKENEDVVARVLASSIAKNRGWRLELRSEQARGLRNWHHRGMSSGGTSECPPQLSLEQVEACIRCWPAGDEGTGGFFVAIFVREEIEGKVRGDEDNDEDYDDVWEGFSSS
ncbi:putative NOL1/NOP2/sun domain-containing protein [Trichophyton interdigitale]|uniref:NOL1/NOP2/sun domain-containing protein n=1 Tax=Trichophyton interdigitale TaxID=101480 RepID=A0A9P5CVG5_9EURO|nr:putative NOL1/NOP2/sun domain-containing protein [Trichophyton interdigitale]KAF3894769.1 putative NOL1/NOP2/sun domain-containing protein [Trichophyton interdigitale]KAG8209623.1 putative NOL1/NOP2/sun domain-containing protein [Trichophyton interdigitale]